jgi:ribosomal protein S18 acetylase RimI-like enzyme
MRIIRATPALARRQASWIVKQEPWRGMGYQAGPLGRWLGRRAGLGQVSVALQDQAAVAIIVTQPEVLLGHFIALLAVAPGIAGRGLGRALVENAAARAAKQSRWLYTSSDTQNRAAAAFYRKLGFSRVGRLPDLVRAGRVEVLWRRPALEPG